MSASDETLAAQAKAGDRRAFDALIGRHKQRLYMVCRRCVGDADDASDLVQEAFASAWLGLRRYDPGRPFSAWLNTIALNKCRDFSRRRTARRLFLAAFARDADRPEVSEPGASPEDDRLHKLDQAIARLPTGYKEVLLLTVFGGLSHQGAATQLGLTAKAVEMRVFRAKRLLAQALGSPDSR